MKRLALWVFGLLTACGVHGQSVNVTPAEASRLMEDPTVFLLDVRTPGEYEAEHIAGSTLIPVQTLETQGGSLPQDKSLPVLVYCRSGNRSATAAGILSKLGYQKIYEMKGGIIGWKKAGLTVQTTPSPPTETPSPAKAR